MDSRVWGWWEEIFVLMVGRRYFAARLKWYLFGRRIRGARSGFKKAGRRRRRPAERAISCAKEAAALR